MKMVMMMIDDYNDDDYDQDDARWKAIKRNSMFNVDITFILTLLAFVTIASYMVHMYIDQ